MMNVGDENWGGRVTGAQARVRVARIAMSRIKRAAIALSCMLLIGDAFAQQPAQNQNGSTVVPPDVQRTQNQVITPSGGNPSQTPGQSQTIQIDNSKNGSIQIQQGAPATPSQGSQQTPLVIQDGTKFQVDSSGQRVRIKGQSTTSCGGTGQPRCSPSSAQLVGFARTECGTGHFFDLGKWSCWSCPEGYERGIAVVDTDRACRKKRTSKPEQQFVSANFGGSLCERPGFYDPIRGGECWQCPNGYDRSAAHVEASDACVKPYDYSAATKGKRTDLPSDCWYGNHFWDGKGGGHCWSCPNGYARTVHPVDDWKACGKDVKADDRTRHATKIGKAECGPGEFLDINAYNPNTKTADLRTGGSCWSCPAGADRTLAPVASASACEVDLNFEFARATQQAAFTCAPDEIFDPVNAINASVKDRLANVNAVRQALGLEELKAKGLEGTCWRCRPGSVRTLDAVYSASACSPADIEWQPASYQQPGLFGLPGAEEVAAALIRDGALINTIADGMAPALKVTSAEARRRAWQEIATEPQSSAVLKTAVLALLEGAVASPDAVSKLSPEMQKLVSSTKASPEMQKLIKSAGEEMKAFAVFLAQDALNAYDAWSAGYEFHKQDYKRSNLQNAFEYGKVPPDFEDITAQSILGSMVPVGASSTALSISMLPESVFKQVFPHTWRNTDSAAAAAKLAAKTGKPVAKAVTWADDISKPLWTELGPRSGAQVAGRTAAQAGAKAAVRAGAEVGEEVGKALLKFSSGLVLAMSAGPQIIVTISMELISISVEQFVDIQQARPKLVTRLNQTRNVPPDLARLMRTTDGQDELERRWMLLMAGTTPPFQPTRFALSAQDIEARVALAAGKGLTVAQATTTTATPATTVTPVPAAVSGSATSARQSSTATATGTGPAATPGSSAPPAQGTAGPVVAVPHPEALDIAVGPTGTLWYTSRTEPASAPDKLIYYVTPQGPKALPSGAAVRIAVDATNNPWVVNSLGHLFRWDGAKWLYIRANVKDIALSAGNRIWALDASGIAHRWDGGNTWTPAVQKEGHLGAAIAVDPAGNPWLVSRVGEIWRMQNGAWQKLQGWASDVAIAADGTAFVVGTAGQIWKMAPGAAGWEMVPGAIGVHVGAGPAGTVHYTK